MSIKSPFLWYVDIEPSMFASDPAFKARKNTALSKSSAQTLIIDEKRKKGLSPGTIRGLSKRSEEALVANKRFSSYLNSLSR